ncbi:MAG: type II toxin-antitoxin system RelE/ParE family toxin [Nanoarchaeota archaeon]
MDIIFSEEFQEEFKKIKDKVTRIRIIKHIKKLKVLPESGKPLKHDLKGYRSTKVPPFRLIYRIDGDTIIINCFDHRKDVYER